MKAYTHNNTITFDKALMDEYLHSIACNVSHEWEYTVEELDYTDYSDYTLQFIEVNGMISALVDRGFTFDYESSLLEYVKGNMRATIQVTHRINFYIESTNGLGYCKMGVTHIDITLLNKYLAYESQFESEEK